MIVGEKGVAWRRLRLRGTPGHGSMPYGSDNALVKAAKIVSRLAEYRPTPRFHELWRGQVASLGLDDDTTAAMLDESAIDELLAGLPNPGAQRFLHACTHTTFSPNVVGTKGQPKTNVIPDIVDLDVDIRTMPGEHTDEVTAHLRAALGDDLFERTEVEILMDDPASISRTDTPLWDALQRAVNVPFPDARLNPQFTRRLHRLARVPRAGGDLLRRRLVQPRPRSRASSTCASTATTNESMSRACA